MRISNDVANVLAESHIAGQLLYLPDRLLERNLYLAVDKVLKAIKGKWNRQAKAHVFDVEVEDIIEEILQTGEYVDAKKEYQFFETPDRLARDIIIQNIPAGFLADEKVTFLEPSAGRGAIARLLGNRCDCIELNEDNRKFLLDDRFNLVAFDFMNFYKTYDVIVANPPFSKQQDIDHVNRMLDLAKKQVVSIMSGSVLWRENRKTTEFRLRVQSLGGTIEALSEDSFVESGTKVQTCLVNVIF